MDIYQQTTIQIPKTFSLLKMVFKRVVISFFLAIIISFLYTVCLYFSSFGVFDFRTFIKYYPYINFLFPFYKLLEPSIYHLADLTRYLEYNFILSLFSLWWEMSALFISISIIKNRTLLKKSLWIAWILAIIVVSAVSFIVNYQHLKDDGCLRDQNCIVSTYKNNKDLSICEKASTYFTTDSKPRHPSLDFRLDNDLGDGQVGCYTKIAYVENDVKICDDLSSDKDQKNYCFRHLIDLPRKSGDCEIIRNSGNDINNLISNQCYVKVATAENNPDTCLKIKIVVNPDPYQAIAVNRCLLAASRNKDKYCNPPELKGLITNSESYCDAIINRNVDYCDKIKSGYDGGLCKDEFTRKVFMQFP